MSTEEQAPEATPLEPGKLTIATQATERKELPNGQIFQAHIEKVGVVDFGEGDRLEVGFALDAPDDFKGQTFKKWFNPSAAGPKAGIVKLALAVYGAELSEEFDPTNLVGKPLQVIFQPDTFNGRDIQVANYLPPVAGQKTVKKDVVIADTEDIEATLNEVFGPAKEA